MTDLGFNPRYVNYAKSHGKTPDEMLTADRERWPGGSMCGFILWIGERHREYRQINPGAYIDGHLVDHAAFDSWLDQRNSAMAL